MNTLENPTIEEEITSIDEDIHRQRKNIRAHYDNPEKIAVFKAKLQYLREKLKILQSLLEEQAAGWEIVFLQTQNDHDEVWKCASPGPHVAKLLPESLKLDFVIPENARANSVLGISFMLYQVQTTLSKYQEFKSLLQLSLKSSYKLLAYDRADNSPNLELEERRVKEKTETTRELFQVLDPKICFLRQTLRYYESVLESYAKSAMFSRFENLGSFLPEGRIVAENKNEPLIKGRLSIHIQSITGITGTCMTLELYDFWELRDIARPSHATQYAEWAGTEISLDYDDVDTRTEIELMIYKNDETNLKTPVGAVWLRVMDILHSSNATADQDVGSTTVDSWFTIAPEGKIRLKLVFVKHLEQTLEERDRRITDHTRYRFEHDFVYKKFYHRMLCAECVQYFYYGTQCQKCRMACHRGCHMQLGEPGFLVPCLDAPEEMKQRFRNPYLKHQFVPLFNISANWCCHCGFYLSPGQGNCEGANRRCEKCGLTCHAQCAALVGDRCREDILTKTYKADED